MNPDDFEKRLQRVPLRKIPSEWRTQILNSAAPSRHPAPVTSLPSTLNSQLSALLWPNPKAWAGLAAVWIFIFALHLSIHESAPMMATISSPSSTTGASLKEQQRILVELMDNSEPNGIEKPRPSPAQPHTERRRATCMA